MGREIRKSDHYFKSNRKKEQVLENLSKSIEKKRRQNQCDCLHTSENGFDVRIAKRTKDEIIFECRNCKKRIYANRIPENMAAQSIKSMDMMCDTIKMNLNIRRKKDVNIADSISFVQNFVLYFIGPLYAATQLRKENKKSIDTGIYGKTFIRRGK